MLAVCRYGLNCMAGHDFNHARRVANGHAGLVRMLLNEGAAIDIRNERVRLHI